MTKDSGDGSAGWQLFESAKASMRHDDIQGAIDYLAQAVREFRLHADGQGECYALHWLAVAHNDTGNFEQAATYHERGLELARTLPKAYVLLAEHLDGLGTSHSNMGKWQKAMEYFEQALAETKKPVVGLRERRARIMQHLANVYTRYAARYEEAVRLYDEAIVISKECQDTHNIGYCLLFKAQAMDAMSNIEAGLKLYEQAREIAEAGKLELLLAACYAHLAASYKYLDQTPLARKYCEQALELDRKYGSKQGMTRDLLVLGQLHAIDGNEDAALAAYRESFLLARSIKDVKMTMHALQQLAHVYKGRLQAHQARTYYEEALALCGEIGDKRSEIQLTLDLASVGNVPDALETFERLLSDAKEGGFSDLEQDIEIGLARIYDHRGNYESAITHYQRSVALIEQMRSSFQVEEHLKAFNESNAEIYDRLVDLCLLLGRKTDAFKHSEFARARVLNNLRHTRKARPLSKLHGHQLDQYKNVIDQIILLDLQVQSLRKDDRAIPQDLEDRLRQALIKEAELILSIKRAAADTWAVDYFNAASLEDLQERLGTFDQKILVLVYYTTEENSYVFVVDKDGFDIVPLEMNRAKLRDLIQAFRRGLRIRENPERDLGEAPEEHAHHKPAFPRGATPASYLQPSQRLYDVLIRRIEKKCLAADHLCFIPHGPLHFMPFHALHDGKQYLIEQKPVSYALSATTLCESLAEKFVPINNVLALGDPQSQMRPLEAARREVETIESQLGSERCLQASGKRATRDLIMKAGGGSDAEFSFDCWHLAMHGVFVHSAPHLSYFQMASTDKTESRVFAFEIAGMEQVGRLSVLSACQTAMTRESRGDELSGFLFSFMAAGAQSVVASLWSVEDESTASLMEGFYAHLDDFDRLSLATALQKAELAVLATAEANSPYYWAPFVLHGSWNPIRNPAPEQRANLLQARGSTVSEARVRAQILLREGESRVARARMASEKQSWAFLPDDERAELERAIEIFSQALELAPDWPDAYRQRGIAYHNLWEVDKALADLRRAAEWNPDDALAAACLGLILADRNQERQLAIESLERAFRLDPKLQLPYRRTNTVHFYRALEGLRAKKTIEECTNLITGSTRDAGLLAKRGFAYWQLSYSTGDNKENQGRATEDFTSALRLDSRCGLAATHLAWIEYSDNKPGAIEAYARIVETSPQCAEAHLRLADAYRYNRQAQLAANEYKAALSCDPTIEHAYCGLGQDYLEMAELQNAIQAFEAECKISPNCFDAYLFLKEIYGALGHYKEASTAYEECLRTTGHTFYEGKLGVGLSDDVSNWIRKLARQEVSVDHTSEAPRELQMTEFERYLGIGHKLTEAGQFHEAIAVYSALIERDPAFPLAYAYRGGCYSTVGQLEKALEDFHKAIELDPECAVAYFNLYVFYNNRGEGGIAQQYLDRAIVLDPQLAKRIRKEGEKR